mmetsp:Transcript_31371/g.91925  ORF Transcript_31371/g.91925 Transcript_31371/m.91925 type:complete len:206 (+) Transcript_31371:650-1267(+)
MVKPRKRRRKRNSPKRAPSGVPTPTESASRATMRRAANTERRTWRGWPSDTRPTTSRLAPPPSSLWPMRPSSAATVQRKAAAMSWRMPTCATTVFRATICGRSARWRWAWATPVAMLDMTTMNSRRLAAVRPPADWAVAPVPALAVVVVPVITLARLASASARQPPRQRVAVATLEETTSRTCSLPGVVGPSPSKRRRRNRRRTL